ncbi:M20 family metallopeptidase [Halanaerobium saccharolyticum]|nr:M20 family metallopeptidase [Halanaerobium saccharolyticum]
MTIKDLPLNKSEEILQKLIRTNTENPPGNEKDAVDVILDYFEKYDLEKNIIDHGDNRASLYLKIKGISDKSIAFIGHIDTVPVENKDGWELDPFDAKIVGDYIYGRGSADMKGGVAAMITAALHILDNNIIPKKTLYFCFTADEESGGLGAKALIKENILKNTEFIFIPEPTGCQLGLAEKGALWLKITAHGKPAHASMPDNGVNAIENIFSFISSLKNEILDDKKHYLLGKSSAEITTINGGIKTNIIPELAEATVDIRTIPGDKHDLIIEKANKLIEKFKEKSGVEIRIKIENNRPPLKVKENDDNIIKLKEIFADYKFNPNIKGLNFYTDASQIIPELNCPFVIFGPGEDSMAHQTNEKTKLKSVKETARVFLEYILR